MDWSALISKVRYIFIGISAILLALYAIFIHQFDTVSSLQAAYAVFVIVLGLLPGVVALLNKREAELIPLLPLHGLFYALTFGLTVFSSKTQSVQPLPEFVARKGWIPVGDDVLTEALVLTIFGQICLYLGYYSFRSLYGKLKPIRLRNVPLHQQLRFSWFLSACYLLLQFVPALRALPSVDQLVNPLGYMSLGIFALLAFDQKLSRWHLVSFIFVLALTLLNALLSGSLAPIVLFLVFFGILYWNQKRRIPWHFLVICGLIAILLNPVKGQFRSNTWYSQDTSVSFLDKAILLGRAVQEHYADTFILNKVSEDASVVNRLAHIATFAYVVAATPEFVPYWSGDSYRTLWTSFIPRALWPGKPQSTIGQEFGHRYGLLQTYDTGTSMNLPWLTEFYANFGTFGVLAGMFFVGVFFRILLQKLRVPASFPMEHVLAVTITFSLFYAESNFALMVGGILPSFIVLVVLMRLLTSGPFVAPSDYGRRAS